MSTRSVWLSAVHFLLLVMLFVGGGVFIGLAVMPQWRAVALQMFAAQPHSLMVIGYGLIIFGLLLFAAFYAMNRGRYYQISMERGARTHVDPQLIGSLVAEYLERVFSTKKMRSEVLVHSHEAIEVLLDMPDVLSFTEQRLLLVQIERDLSALFFQVLGHRDSFLLTVRLK